MKRYKVRLEILAVAAIALSVLAPLSIVNAKNTDQKIFRLPKTATAVSEFTYDLGVKVDPATNKKVRGYAFITPKGHQQRPDHAGKKPGGGNTSNACFAFLSKGMKWRVAEPWQIDPQNSEGLDENTLFANLSADIQKWEQAANAEIFGIGTVAQNLSAEQSGSPDGNNEIMFGNIQESDVIAVTIVWGIYGGAPHNRQIVEWDQIYDQGSFDWSLTGEAGKMDFDNIATHEVGHAAGLGHPEDACVDETMYRYANVGELKKRDLAAGDVAGISSLY